LRTARMKPVYFLFATTVFLVVVGLFNAGSGYADVWYVLGQANLYKEPDVESDVIATLEPSSQIDCSGIYPGTHVAFVRCEYKGQTVWVISYLVFDTHL